MRLKTRISPLIRLYEFDYYICDMKTVVFILLISVCSLPLQAQDMLCNVSVNASQVSGSDKQIYETMQTAIYEFINNRKWTNSTFKNEERIECSILLTITERQSTDQFKGTLQIQSRRPVFKTSYYTTLFNHIDKEIDFKYLESEALDFSLSTHMSNLTSLMAFYVYVILGIDYDSFAKDGGAPYYEKAQTVVTNAQNASEKGWKSFESQKNRYWIIENLLNKNNQAFRDCFYNYHRLGMDILTDKPEQARNSITNSLDALLKLKRTNPNICYFQIFFTSKSDEIVNIYSEAPDIEKARVVKILNELDPSNAGKYKKITTGGN
jgi:hypothetical protein